MGCSLDAIIRHSPFTFSILPFKYFLQVSTILNTLWDTLLDLDDLTASTNSIMTLLASLLSYPVVFTYHSQATTRLVPRLWPFLRHNITSVRKAVLETLCTLLFAERQQVIKFTYRGMKCTCRRFHQTLPNFRMKLRTWDKLISVSIDVKTHWTHHKLGQVTRPNSRFWLQGDFCWNRLQGPMS